MPSRSIHILAAAIAAVLSWSIPADAAVVAGPALPGPGLCLATGLEYGAPPATGTLGVAGESDCWRLIASAGDRVRVRVVGTSGGLAPRIEIAGCTTSPVAEATCALGGGGHSVLVRAAAAGQTGGYALSVQRLDDPVGCSALIYGQAPRTGVIAAGETECWRFPGASGDRVRLRLVTPSVALAPRAEVVRPDGATVCAASGSTNQTCVLDASGTHTVLVRVAGAYAGGYSLSIQRLADPVGCSAKPFGTAAERGVVTLTGETDCWRFEGVPGQPVRLTTVRTAGTLSPAVEVLRPNGTTRCGPSPADELTCRPDVRGTHTILLRDGQGPQLGEYRLGLQRLVDPVGCAALAYGTNVTVAALATTGETGCWRFTGGAGDRLRLRAVGTSGALIPIAEVLDGLGSTTCAPAHDCRLDASGAHTILLRDSLGTRTGAYRISIQRLNNPVGCEDEPGSDGVGGSIDAAGLGCWRLDGDAGDLVRRRVIDTGPGLDPVTEVVRPDGTTVCSPSTHDSETCELDADGAHAILVQGASGASSGEYRIATIQLNDPFYSCANLATSPSAHSASIAGAAEVDCYTTWAPEAGMRSLRVEATSGTLQPVVEILKPDGALRCRTTAPDGWFDCYGDIYEYSRILVYDVSGLGRGNYEIDRR